MISKTLSGSKKGCWRCSANITNVKESHLRGHTNVTDLLTVHRGSYTNNRYTAKGESEGCVNVTPG